MDADWILRENAYNPAEVPKYETLFSLGNGYLGIRGTFEEHEGNYKPATFINGFYESEPIIYGEHAYGYAKNRQRMVPLTDGTKIRMYIEGDLFSLETGKVERFSRSLDMRTGVLTREVEWESPKGHRLTVRFRRLVSAVNYHSAAFQVTLIPGSGGFPLRIVSGLFNSRQFTTGSFDPRVGNFLQQNPLMLVRKSIDTEIGMMRYKTRNSGLSYACAMTHSLSGAFSHTVSTEKRVHEISHRFSGEADGTAEITLEKYIAYYTSLETSPQNLVKESVDEASRTKTEGFSALEKCNMVTLRDFWKGADVRIESTTQLQDSIRLNMFHLLQAAGKHGNGNVPAKGLTGEGYEGHYFWDTEIYLLPFFTYTVPEIAKSLLIYRYNTLPAAKARAEELHHKGALYPWRTINGNEASAYFPAGTAQYHINADIAYACRRFWHLTGDDDFILNYGGEIIVETARFWADFVDYVPGKGYCINSVTGPDEYTAIVNNNAYTNYMAKANLAFAREILSYIEKQHPDRRAELTGKLRISSDEIDAWKEIEKGIYIPSCKNRGLIPQDDSFFEKAVWDFNSVPEDRYPLLLHYHPLTIYRHQVLKQPDLILAFLLLSGSFTKEEKYTNYEYYDPLTTGDSSLSSCIQSIIATEIGKIDEGEKYFLKTARMDLDDINKNVKDGIHAAAMGGTWLTLIYGFAGLRDDGDIISFAPRLPSSIGSLSFYLKIRGNVLSVRINTEGVRYTLVKGTGLSILHYGKKTDLHPEKTVFLHIYAH